MEKNKFGFTIIELLVVITVIGILSSFVIVAFQGIQQKTRNTARIQTVRAIQNSMALYQAEFGKSSLYQMTLSGVDGQCIGVDYEDVAPNADYSCRWVVPNVGSPFSAPVNQVLYDALRSKSQYNMKYSPVTQNNFSSVTSVTSSAPFLSVGRYTNSSIRSTIDNGSLRDYFVLLSYRLEGIDQNCTLPVVRITSQTAGQTNFTSGYPYSVTNGGATECWLWLDW